MARRGARAIGNPDGSPRLELVDDATLEVVDAGAGTGGDPEAEAPVETPTEGLSDEQVLAEFLSKKKDEAYSGSSLVTEEGDEQPRGQRSFYSKKKAAKQAEENATYFLMIIEGAAVLGFGEDARLLSSEKKRIEEPMARMMSRMDPQVAEALQKWTDPVLLVFGLAAWGGRLYGIAKDASDDSNSPPRRKPDDAVPPPSPNGHERRTVDEVLEQDTLLSAGPTENMRAQFGSTGMIQ